MRGIFIYLFFCSYLEISGVDVTSGRCWGGKVWIQLWTSELRYNSFVLLGNSAPYIIKALRTHLPVVWCNEHMIMPLSLALPAHGLILCSAAVPRRRVTHCPASRCLAKGPRLCVHVPSLQRAAAHGFSSHEEQPDEADGSTQSICYHKLCNNAAWEQSPFMCFNVTDWGKLTLELLSIPVGYPSDGSMSWTSLHFKIQQLQRWIHASVNWSGFMKETRTSLNMSDCLIKIRSLKQCHISKKVK